ncbi:hypothetical protein C2S52_022017 [Perilla frutescens var. hirtella]|uniref:BHLH domain-containing protein n=1 Tax=Perilla frutescens var. hirtella TaxID=608512 RepID=A0AAD4IQR7_PERFH|nr:hypothetical protein C2S53_009265 [Perilla frutescens var. hirtella]KAH6797463.1 hypothetical protein C2S52_022017 [Perilla frutescens var. hirtella]KAH6807575.1 hypothetical protein C2S51_028683 [Perilla frutescens var. frutescens]
MSISSMGKLERKTIEKNRRIMMKCLCFKMVSLIPPHHFNPPKELLSQQDQIEQAAGYIEKLSARVKKLRRRKAEALRLISDSKTVIRSSGSKLPVVKLRDLGNSSLEVVVITGFPTRKITLPRLVRVIEEEGAEVVTASLSHIADKIFHTLHARAKLARVGVDISRICGRLEELMIC